MPPGRKVGAKAVRFFEGASPVRDYLLFDNRIGRKRNVDGGVLADCPLKRAVEETL